jgi:hypothetical protein
VAQTPCPQRPLAPPMYSPHPSTAPPPPPLHNPGGTRRPVRAPAPALTYDEAVALEGAGGLFRRAGLGVVSEDPGVGPGPGGESRPRTSALSRAPSQLTKGASTTSVTRSKSHVGLPGDGKGMAAGGGGAGSVVGSGAASAPAPTLAVEPLRPYVAARFSDAHRRHSCPPYPSSIHTSQPHTPHHTHPTPPHTPHTPHPTHPTHPTRPTRPTRPTHPTHPTPPPHPTPHQSITPHTPSFLRSTMRLCLPAHHWVHGLCGGGAGT